MKKNLTCIECPIGCEIEVDIEDGKVISVKGNTCPRGKMYAENEVICPKRVVTSTVRAENGVMVPVKTDKPIKKTEIFTVMKKINETTCVLPVKIGDILVENISDDANLVVAGNV
jgi:CxxC motif-containing protein